jgi:preprotein translocase SecE subunit
MKDVLQFFNEVKVELTRVIWPKFDEWVGSTVIVLVLVAVLALYLYFVDGILSLLVHRIFDYYSGF